MARFLTADEVELRVSNTAKDHSKCQLLVYKDARTDMALLDELYGAGNWQTDYKEIKGNMYCGIGVLFNGQWVWRWNCGVESKGTGDDDENNKKGEASDAFKRAGFLWGIGRELYNWKNISIKLSKDDFWIQNQGQQSERWVLTTRFSVATLEYKEDGSPLHMVIVDDDMRTRFEYGKSVPTPKEEKPTEPTKQPDTTILKAEPLNNAPTQEKSDSKPILTAEQVKEKNKNVYSEILNTVFGILNNANYPAAEPKAKEIVREYFPRNKLDFSIIELTSDPAQKEPSIKGRVLVLKDDIWNGKNNYESLKHTVDQEINIYEMGLGR